MRARVEMVLNRRQMLISIGHVQIYTVRMQGAPLNVGERGSDSRAQWGQWACRASR